LSDEPLFSVLVPVFNRAHLIEDCLNSVFEQTYTNWQLVVVDDGSEDSIESVITKFPQEKIKFIRMNSNEGVGSAFRRAATEANGELIGMLGSDDALVREALEDMVLAHLKMKDCSLITSSQLPCDENLNPTMGLPEYRPSPNQHGLISGIENGNFATFKRMMYQQTAGFDSSLRAAVDHDIYLKLEETGNIGFIDKPLYLYRKHSKAVSQGEHASKMLEYDYLSYIYAHKRRKGTKLPKLNFRKFHYYLASIYQKRYLKLMNQKSLTALALKIRSKFHRLLVLACDLREGSMQSAINK